MYYLSLSGLECKVKNKRTIDAKITCQVESYVNSKIITNRKGKSDRLAEREKQKHFVMGFEVGNIIILLV